MLPPGVSAEEAKTIPVKLTVFESEGFLVTA
jgi:hypothetical protein